MKTIKSVLIGALVAFLGSSAQAATTQYKGQTITYTGTASLVSGGSETTHRTIQFTSGNGTLVIPEGYQATASILVVGGGGAGMTGGGSPNRYGTSGTGGDVVQEKDISLPAGTYSVTVGAGGTSQSAAGKNSTFGGVTGFDTRTGKGATAVSGRVSSRAAGADGANAGTCDFAPNPSTKYGAGGDQQPNTNGAGSNAQANIGKGGQGARGSNAGGNGGSGVVIVRLTDLVKPEYVDYGTNTLVIAKGKTSAAQEVTSEAAAQWKFWSENTSVATVSKATGATAASDNFTITAVDTEGKSTYCVASNKYAKYTFKVEGPKVEVDMGEVRLSHGECVTLTNKLGEAIAWTGAGSDTYTTENPDVAKVVSSNGFACVTNMVHDGAVEVVLGTATTKYTYLVRCMTVEIEKTVLAANDPSNPKYDAGDRSNATIRVTTHVLYGVHEIPTNNILFITSTCSTHGLKEDLLKGQIDTLATKGAVDYFFYAHANNATDAAKTDAAYEGHLAMSNKLTRTIDVSSGKHYNLKAYLNCLSTKLDLDHKNYDYVVLSFDSARLGNTYPKNNKDMEADVAAKLRWYYENKRVIWITDAAYDGSNKTGSNSYLDYDTWEALCAIMDPITYCTKPAGSRYVSHSGSLYQGTKNTLQAVYTDKTATEKMLSDNVKMATYDTELVDKVLNLNKSLSIVPTGDDTTKQEVHFYTWAGKSAPAAPEGGVIADLPKGDNGWRAEPESAFKVDGYQVTANVSNITQETWNMFEISIVDNGTFLQECLAHDPPLAKLDPKTGKYMVDPNDGPAHVTLYSDEGGRKLEVQAEAKTTVPWPFDLIPLKIYVDDATVTYGDDVPTTLGWKSGAARYDLPNVDESKINGLNTVTFGTDYTKGSPVGSGYTINTNSAALSSTYYAITVVPGKLTVKPATIEPVEPGKTPTDPTKPYTAAPCIVKTYDGEGTNITAEVFNVTKRTDVPTFLYSLNEDGPFWPWDQITIRDVELDDADEVTSNKVWYTVTTKTAGGDENYFAATNFAWILVKPRPVKLTAASESWLYDGNEHKTNGWSVTSGSFVPGEGVDTTHFSMTDESVIKDCGEVVNAIDEDKLQPMNGTSLDNYDITLDTGWLRVSGVDITATAEDVEITYDGTKTNITVKIGESYEPHGDFKIWYAYDKIEHVEDEKRGFAMVRPADAPPDSDFTMDESPKFMDAGTNRVWFKVVDLNENYSNYYGSARIKILPRPVHFTFPKAVKPYDGTTTGVPLATNLIGAADNMVGAEWFDCTATGTFTSPNVGDGADYFHLDDVTIDGKKNAFKRNYVITYDGEDDQLVPGAITILPIDPVPPADPSDNPGDEPEPTDGPTIWAQNVVKVYDGIGTNIIAKVYNNVTGNTFTYEYSSNGVDFVAWDALQFTNVVEAQKVWYRAMTAQGNYLGVTNFAYVTITPAQIVATTKTGTKTTPYAYAENVEIWIDDLPQGGSTNIIVKSELLGSDQPTYRYSVKDPAKGAEWIDAASFAGFSLPTLATNVWCEVSGGSNYLSTNVVAHVAIWQREAEIEGGDSIGNAAEIQEALKTNANKYKTSEHEYVKLRVTVTPADEVPADDFVGRKIRTTKTEADNQANAIIALASAKAKVAESEIKADLYDLVLERTYDKAAGDALAADGFYNESDWDDIGASGENKDLYKFEFDYNKPAGYDLVGVCKYHAGSPVWLSEGAGQADRYTITWKGGKQVLTMWLKEFCVGGPCFAPHIDPGCGPCSRCPEEEIAQTLVYKLQMNLKTTKGAAAMQAFVAGSNCERGEDSCFVYRTKDTTKFSGWIYDCTATCNTIANGSVIVWDAKRKVAFEDGAAFNTMFINVIGKKKSDAEWAWAFGGAVKYDESRSQDYVLTGAGFGKFSSKGYYTSFSGRVAGTASPSWDLKTSTTKASCACSPSQVLSCSDLSTMVDGIETVVFGTWSAKYDASASKRYTKDGYLKIPSYAK